MDPLTLLVVAAGIAWVTAAPDRHTLTASRGTVGAARAAGRAAWQQARTDLDHQPRPTRGPRRHQRTGRTARAWRRWNATSTGRATRAVGRGVVRAGTITGRAVRAGASAAPTGWNTAATAAVARQTERHTRRARPGLDRTGFTRLWTRSMGRRAATGAGFDPDRIAWAQAPWRSASLPERTGPPPRSDSSPPAPPATPDHWTRTATRGPDRIGGPDTGPRTAAPAGPATAVRSDTRMVRTGPRWRCAQVLRAGPSQVPNRPGPGVRGPPAWSHLDGEPLCRSSGPTDISPPTRSTSAASRPPTTSTPPRTARSRRCPRRQVPGRTTTEPRIWRRAL